MPFDIGVGIPDALEFVRDAIGLRCDVTAWDDQVKLFEAAVETYRSVDIVVRSGPLCGLGASSSFFPPRSRTLV